MFITKYLGKKQQQWLMNFTYSIIQSLSPSNPSFSSSSLSKSSSSSSPSSSSYCLGSCWARADLRMMSGQAAMIGEITNTVHGCIWMLFSQIEYFWARTYSSLLRCIQITTAIFWCILVILNLASVKIAIIHLQHHVYLAVWPSTHPLPWAVYPWRDWINWYILCFFLNLISEKRNIDPCNDQFLTN